MRSGTSLNATARSHLRLPLSGETDRRWRSGLAAGITSDERRTNPAPPFLSSAGGSLTHMLRWRKVARRISIWHVPAVFVGIRQRDGRQRGRGRSSRRTSHKKGPSMSIMYIFIILCGLAAVAYGAITARTVLACSTGTDRMRQISAAVQEGAAAYLNRQYTTIGIVGIVIAIILLVVFKWNWTVAVGYLIGAVL